MDLKSALAKLGRDILVTFGLVTLVQVGFREPVLRTEPNGTGIVETRITGAITEEMIPLVEKSVPVVLGVNADLYSTAGTKTSVATSQRMEYRSLDRVYVVTKDAKASEYRSLESAIAAVETFAIAIPTQGIKSIVLSATLSLPTFSDAETVASLWRGNKPSAVFTPGRP